MQTRVVDVLTDLGFAMQNVISEAYPVKVTIEMPTPAAVEFCVKLTRELEEFMPRHGRPAFPVHVGHSFKFRGNEYVIVARSP